MIIAPPLSLYIHFPWCIRKCPYCDFNSHNLKQELPEQAYIAVLLADLQADLPLIKGREIISIFMGGGTPSLFSPEALSYLLQELSQLVKLSETIEITLEANPGTVEQSRFLGYRQAGINRLSLGIQSFQDKKLKALGRIHDSQAAIKAVNSARQAGFTNFNLDLMFGLPEQSVADALSDLQTAIELQPTHLSWYQLTLEPNTLFYHQPPQLPPDENIWDIQQQGQQLLANAGYRQYEVSAYSLPDFPCRHNRNYWEFGDYLGIGAGAHGKITDNNTGKIIRTLKAKHPKDYLATHSATLTNQTPIHTADLAFEFMLNALRLKQPISYQLFEARTGMSATQLKQPLQNARNQNLIELTPDGFAVTEHGWHFLNDLTALFLFEN